MRKVCQITTVIPPAKDGVGAAAIKIHKLLCRNGIESVIITSSNQKADENILYVVNKWSIKELIKIIKQIHNKGFQTIIIHYPSPYIVDKHFFVFLSLILLLFGIPLTIYLHEFSVYTLLGKIKIYILLVFAEKIITTDSKNFNELQKLPFIQSKLFLLPTGSNFTLKFDFSCDRNLNISKDKILIAYWGYIMRGKGILNFLNFVESFNDETAEFLFIGDVPETASDYDRELKEKVRSCSKLKFLGYLTDDNLISTILKFDILILPYEDGLTERRGSFMLAMQLGKVVITTRPKFQIPGLVNNFNVIYFDTMDELNQIVKKLISDKQLLLEISSNAHKWYNKFYSNEKFLKRFLEIINGKKS